MENVTKERLHGGLVNTLRVLADRFRSRASETRGKILSRICRVMQKPLVTMTENHIGVVMGYMKSQNRPYSTQNVFDNLRGELAKSKVQAGLDAGVEDGCLVVKSFGAQKIYCIKQQDCTASSEDESKKSALKDQLGKLQEESSSQRQRLDDLNSDLGMFMRYKKALECKSSVISRIAELHAQINSIESSRKHSDKKAVSAINVNAITAEITGLARDLEKRRRICRDMISQLCDHTGTSRKELIGDLGLDTDDSTMTTSA